MVGMVRGRMVIVMVKRGGWLIVIVIVNCEGVESDVTTEDDDLC